MSAKIWGWIGVATAAIIAALGMLVLPRRDRRPRMAPPRTHLPPNSAAQIAIEQSEERARHNQRQLSDMAAEAEAGGRPSVAAMVEASRK